MNLLEFISIQSAICSNCKSNHVIANQISTLSNQIFFSQIKSPHRLHVIKSWFKSEGC